MKNWCWKLHDLGVWVLWKFLAPVSIKVASSVHKSQCGILFSKNNLKIPLWQETLAGSILRQYSHCTYRDDSSSDFWGWWCLNCQIHLRCLDAGARGSIWKYFITVTSRSICLNSDVVVRNLLPTTQKTWLDGSRLWAYCIAHFRATSFTFLKP